MDFWREPRSRAVKQEKSYLEVTLALQRELIRRGYFNGPERLDFHWTHIMSRKAPKGVEWHFLGRVADVLEATIIVDVAYQWHVGLLAKLRKRAMEATKSPGRLEGWLALFRKDVKRALLNTRYAGTKRVQVGSRVAGGAYDLAMMAVDQFLEFPSTEHAQCLVDALVAAEPSPIATGFYGPKGSGARGHFVALLSERGYSAEEIADVLSRSQGRSAGWSEHAQAAFRNADLAAIRSLIRETKPKSSLTVGSATLRADLAQNLPRRVRWGVLVSKGAERRRQQTAAAF